MHAMTCCWRAASQEFSDCLVAEGDRMKCGDLREDYMECLHHSKEVRPPPPLPHRRACRGREAAFFANAHTPRPRLSRAARPLCTQPAPALTPCSCPRPLQVTRINALMAERTRKQKAGEPIPPTLVEEMAKGQLKVPFTKA